MNTELFNVNYKIKEFYKTPITKKFYDGLKINKKCYCAYKVYNRISDEFVGTAVIKNITDFVYNKEAIKDIDSIKSFLENDDKKNFDSFNTYLYAHNKRIKFNATLYLGTTDILCTGSNRYKEFHVDICYPFDIIDSNKDGIYAVSFRKDHNFLEPMFNDSGFKELNFLPQISSLVCSNI